MTGLLIIGYGNPLRGDDAVGYMLAQALPPANRLAVPQLTPELADPIHRASRVIFVDACEAGDPGTIQHRFVSPVAPSDSFTHRLTPEALLAVTAALYGRAPDAEIYTIAGESFAFSTCLSPAVEHARQLLLNRLGL